MNTNPTITAESVRPASPPFSLGFMDRDRGGKLRIKAKNPSERAMKILVAALLGITVLAFATFDYKGIDFGKALADTLSNLRVVFLEPRLSSDTLTNVLWQLFFTFCLGTLATFIGAILAFFFSLLCARNIANAVCVNVVKSLVAVARAVPTILWVLIFAVSAGLGSVAAVAGLSFHSFAYLTKAYAESIAV